MINLTTTGGKLSQFESIKSLKLALIYLLWGSLPRGEPPELEGRTHLQSLPYIYDVHGHLVLLWRSTQICGIIHISFSGGK